MANTPSSSHTHHQGHGQLTGAAAGRKAGEMAEGVLQSVKDAASSVAGKAHDAYDSVAGTAQDAYNATSGTISDFNDDVTKLIKRHPMQAVLIGFGAGCLVGGMLLGGVLVGSRRD